VQSRPTLFDKIFTEEEEEYRLGYSENPDFLRLKTKDTEPIQIWYLYFAPGDSFAGTRPNITKILILCEDWTEVLTQNYLTHLLINEMPTIGIWVFLPVRQEAELRIVEKKKHYFIHSKHPYPNMHSW
jgi:hypothetical protein